MDKFMIDEYIQSNGSFDCLNKPKPLFGDANRSYLSYIIVAVAVIVATCGGILYMAFYSTSKEEKSPIETRTYKKTLDKMKQKLQDFIISIDEFIHSIKHRINVFLFDRHIANDTLIIRKYKPVSLL